MITTLVYVHCDTCGDPHDVAPPVWWTKAVAEADALRNAGYVRRYKTDSDGTRTRIHICPFCRGEDAP